MKRLSETITVIGLGAAVLGGCCLDSSGIYAYAAGGVCILGILMAGTGLLKEYKKTEERKIIDGKNEDQQT